LIDSRGDIIFRPLAINPLSKGGLMHWSAQLQFQRLPPEAQRATLWRLAWSGLAPEQIAQRIGWSTDQVRRAMQDEMAEVQPPPHSWLQGLASFGNPQLQQ
jgi:hypothetical protein